MPDGKSANRQDKPLAELIAETRAQVANTPGLMGPKQDAIPGYEIVREIHRGGQGVVYLAHQLATQRDVAVKMMREGPFAGSGERARFEREAHILASIKHPNIVTIHDSGNAAGNYYFVMDYIPGLPLDAWADGVRDHDDHSSSKPSKQHSTERLLQTFTKICDAVAIAHQRGVIHRDLKPTNIRIDEADEPYVLDFGLAKSVGNEEGDTRGGQQEITATGQFLGTLPWSSPEQVSSVSHLADVRSDVYALGLMLYRSLTGRMPYQVDAALSDMMQIITQQEPIRPTQFEPQLDGDLETITLKCLNKDPDRRYQSAGELAADLRRFDQCEPILARPDSAWYTLRMFARRHRGLVSAAAAFVGLLAMSSIALSLLYAKAKRNEDLATQRALETKRVAEFQNAQLSAIDPELMGARLRDQLQAALIAAGPTRTIDADDAATTDDIEGPPDLAAALAGANLTDVAMKLLEENIFATALTAADEQFADQPLVQAELIQTTTDTMLKLSIIQRAVPAQRKALNLRRQALGDNHSDTLKSQVGLARLLLADGSHDEAESTISDAVQRLSEQFGEDHPATLNAMIVKGKVLLLRGEYDESLDCLRVGLVGLQSTMGSGHEETLDAMASMGSLLQTMERFDEAMQHHQSALAGQQALWGDNHMKTLGTRNNIAAVYYQTGDYAESIARYQEVLTAMEGLLGEEHRQTLATMSNLARAFGSDGQWIPATALHEKILKIRQRVQGPQHMDTLNSMSGLGNVLSQSGQAERAHQLQTQAVAGFRATLGADHPHTIRSINGLALTSQRTGHPDEAIQLFHEAIEGNRRVLGNDNTETLLSIGNLGVLLHARGKLDEADPLLEETSAGMQRVLGSNHHYTNTFMRRYARLLRDQKRFDEALPICEKALETSLTIYGDNRMETHNAKMLVGSIYKAKEQYEAALPYYEASITGYRMTAGDKHPYTLSAIGFLANILEKLNRHDEALQLFEEALAGKREVLAADHPDIVAASAQVGLSYALQNRVGEAVPLLVAASDQLTGNSEYRNLRFRILKRLVELNDTGQLEGIELPDMPTIDELRAEMDEMGGDSAEAPS